MKKIILLLLILIFCTGFSNISEPGIDTLENIFKTYLPVKEGVIYTRVPRGLIVSIDESYFFSEREARIKESSLCILDTISMILKEINKYCVIENHTEENDFTDSIFSNNWEISIMRSENIAQYLTLCCQLPVEKTFALGYGDIMPFKDNVAPQNGMNNRVDFVIIEYESRR